MIVPESKNDIVERLQREILSMQGFRVKSNEQATSVGFSPFDTAFPNHTFPVAAVHEFISQRLEDAAATAGFISCLLGNLMKEDGECLWISTRRTLFPPSLKAFGIEPDRIIFIDIVKDKDILWTMEEALKCDALTAVVCELKEINLTESRRLQIAVERSRVTGFLHRYEPKKIENIACVSRWQISSMNSELEFGMPGLGLPRWNVELLKIRNGKPGAWQIEWSGRQFQAIAARSAKSLSDYTGKTG